jgi:membrane-bound serine protease (ClpP class)
MLTGGSLAARAAAELGAVYVVPITGPIDLGLAPYLERVLAEAAAADAAAVLLVIDTPGGRLDAVLQMRDSLLGSPVRTIAFVDRTAFSAGALIAIAAEEIYMAPGAVIGAATPVEGDTGETASEKVVSAVRKTFKTTAEVRGRDPLIAEAMVAVTASKLASAKGRASSSPSRTSAAGSRSRAMASRGAEASRAVTRAPRRLASKARSPAPHPASSSRVPGTMWAASSTAPASGRPVCSK